MRRLISPAPRLRRARAQRQQGVVALEWALITLFVFFPLLYGMIGFGLTFLVRESMQHAVEESARAALRYPRADILDGATLATWAHREQEARLTLVAALDWLPSDLRPDGPESPAIRFTACLLSDPQCSIDAPLDAALHCRVTAPCLVHVAYEIDGYAARAIAPPLPGFGILYPDALRAQSQVLVDRSLL